MRHCKQERRFRTASLLRTAKGIFEHHHIRHIHKRSKYCPLTRRNVDNFRFGKCMTFVCLTLTDNALIIHHIIFISKLFQLIEHLRIRIINLPQKRPELPLCSFDTLNPIHSQRLCIHMYDLVSRHCICKDTAVFYIKQFFIINILTQFFFAQRIIQFCQASLRLFFFFNTYCLRNILMYPGDSHVFCHRCVSRTTATYKPLSGYRMNITINDFRPCLCKLI